MHLLLDPLGGISGDMFLAALIGLGADPKRISADLKRLRLGAEFRLRARRETRGLVSGVLLDVELRKNGRYMAAEEAAAGHGHGHGAGGGHAAHAAHAQGHSHRSWVDIRKMILAAKLPERPKKRALAVFERLAEAEAEVHGRKVGSIEFHEVGAVDSIIDIVGSCLALELLGVERIFSTAVGVGSGCVRFSHGLFPLPAPATMLLLRGAPLVQTAEEHELSTPTGAAILAGLASFEGVPGTFIVEASCFGLSHKRTKEVAPGLRASLLRPAGEYASSSGLIREELIILSCDLDDMPPEYLALAADRLRKLPVLDLSFAPLHMKKGRPGTELRVLVRPGDADAVEGAIFEHTSTFGVRRACVTRDSLPRETRSVRTRWGRVKVKAGKLPDGGTRLHAEFEDVAKICLKSGASWEKVKREAEGRRE